MTAGSVAALQAWPAYCRWTGGSLLVSQLSGKIFIAAISQCEEFLPSTDKRSIKLNRFAYGLARARKGCGSPTPLFHEAITAEQSPERTLLPLTGELVYA